MSLQSKVTFPLAQPKSRRHNFALKNLLFLGVLLATLPANAHKTEVSGDVAGVWHVEPNHRPIAGQTAQIWVALTRRGGQTLSLQEASCRMAVYREPRKADSKPISQPALTWINIEQYRGVPSAKVTLPMIGLYQAELNCSPKMAGSFKPFQMRYQLTVSR